MLKRILGYLVAVAALIYLFFLYNAPVLSGVLVLALIYPLISYMYLRIVSQKISLSFGTVPTMGEKGKEIPIKITAVNESRVWSVHFRGCIIVRNSCSTRGTKQYITGMAGPREKQTIQVRIASEYCGNVEIRIEDFEIYDLFGVFYIKKKCEEKRHIGIFPEYNILPLEITRRTREFVADGDDYSTEKSGNDSSEIYQIREYRSLDSIHDIHWKLSAKEEKIMIKEHALPLGCVILVWIDFTEAEKTASGFSQMLEQAASLSVTLIEEKCIHMAAWFEEKTKRIVKLKIDSEEAAYEFVWRLLMIEPYKDKNMARACYEEAFKGEHFSTIVKLDGKGDLLVDGTKQELLQL